MFAIFNLFLHYFFNIYGSLESAFQLIERNIYRYFCGEFSEKGDLNKITVLLRFLDDLRLFHFRYLVVCIEVCSQTQIDSRHFDGV